MKDQVENTEPLLTTTDMAKILQCKPSTVTRMWQRGDVPAPDLTNGYNFHRWFPETIAKWRQRKAAR